LRPEEALLEFQKAKSGGNVFALGEIWILDGRGGDEAVWWPAIEAGDGLACGVVASMLKSSSGAARQRLLQICELGIGRGDVRPHVMMSDDLGRGGQKKEGRGLLQKLEQAPVHTWLYASSLRYAALRGFGRTQAAMRLGRRMARLGRRSLDRSDPFLDDCLEHNPDAARVFVLNELEGLVME
jgi:hypothetical protein